MIEARRKRQHEKCNKIVVCTASDKTTMESIVSAQHGLRTMHDLVQSANIAILKIWSIVIWKAPKVLFSIMVLYTFFQETIVEQKVELPLVSGWEKKITSILFLGKQNASVQF